MIKLRKKSLIFLIIFCILITTLTGCSSKNQNEVIQDKIDSELAFLSVKLIDMLNKVNGLSFENYVVEAEEINSKSSQKSSESNSSSEGSESSGTATGSSSSEEGSMNSSSEGGSSGGTESGSGNGGSETLENKVQYRMYGNEILLQEKNTDWNTLKAGIEKLYSDWSIIELDLYKVSVNNQDILNFSGDLDKATQAIKNEDKQASLNALAKLYAYIPIYSSAYSKDANINNLYKTKSNVLNAYVAVEQQNIEQITNEMKNAEQAFLPIVNDMTSQTTNQFNINKAYILIKELQNVNADKDIFYIKYKNLMQELNNI